MASVRSVNTRAKIASPRLAYLLLVAVVALSVKLLPCQLSTVRCKPAAIDAVRFASASRVSAASGASQEASSSASFSLFSGVEESSKLWTSDFLLQTFDDLMRPSRFFNGINEIDFFCQQGNLAKYLGVDFIDGVFLPIPVNLIFIGFSGNGNHGLHLSEADLRRWFRGMDHVRESGHVGGEGGDGGREWSYVNYNFSLHAIEMGPKVAHLFEEAIRVLARVNDPRDADSENPSLHQVDMEGMAAIIDNMLDFMQLNAAAYNLIVINPNKQKSHAKYGYRMGLSKPEAALLSKEHVHHLLSPNLEPMPQLLAAEHVPSPLFPHGAQKAEGIAWTSLHSKQTAQWVSRYEGLLAAEERRVNERTDAADMAVRKAQQMVTSGRSWAREELKGVLRQLAAGYGWDVTGWHPECLTDTWIGNERWAFIDLSAGPFSFGPLASAAAISHAAASRSSPLPPSAFDGIQQSAASQVVDAPRTEVSLPSVAKYFEQLGHGKDLDDDEMESEFQRLADERFRVVDDDSAHELDQLLAEVDVYEMFHQRHCRGKRGKLPLCKELASRLESMKSELTLHDERGKQQEREAGGSSRRDERLLHVRAALERLHAWQLMADGGGSNVENTAASGVKGEASRDAESTAWDLFLAELAATLSSALSHVIAPATAAGRHLFHERVFFHLYYITHQAGYERKHSPPFIEQLKDELGKAQLEGQHFQFAVHRLSLSEDPNLAAAFSFALRSSVLPHEIIDDISNDISNQNKTSFSGGQLRTWLDSAVLSEMLREMGDGSIQKLHKAKSNQAILELPIFIFESSANSPPVLIDETLIAKAMPGMILACHVAEPNWPTGLHCNHELLQANLRNPVRAILAATLQLLGGLMPSHVGFDSHQHLTIRDWRWSVGSNCLASLSSSSAASAQVSAFHRDSLARSHVASALDQSVHSVNSALAALSAEPTHAESFPTFKRFERRLAAEYNDVVRHWKEIASLVEGLKFAEALQLLGTMGEATQRFEALVEDLVSALHPVRCTVRRRLQLHLVPTLFILSAILLCVLCVLLRPRQFKPKIN